MTAGFNNSIEFGNDCPVTAKNIEYQIVNNHMLQLNNVRNCEALVQSRSHTIGCYYL